MISASLLTVFPFKASMICLGRIFPSKASDFFFSRFTFLFNRTVMIKIRKKSTAVEIAPIIPIRSFSFSTSCISLIASTSFNSALTAISSKESFSTLFLSRSLTNCSCAKSAAFLACSILIVSISAALSANSTSYLPSNSLISS